MKKVRTVIDPQELAVKRAKKAIENMRIFMDAHQYQQKSIGITCGMTPGKISQLLNFKRRMRLDDFLRLCAALDRTPYFFMDSTADEMYDA